MSEIIDGVAYDSPFTEFHTNSDEDRHSLYLWKRHFKKLKIRILEKNTSPGKVTLYVSSEDNERKWSCVCKCGGRIIQPPSPYFGEELKGSKEKYGEDGSQTHRVTKK